MFEALGTYLSVVIAFMLGYLIIKLYNFERLAPTLIQEALNSVGESINEIFAKPVVKASMSNLGMKSGEVRATKALKNKVAGKLIGQNVLLKKGLEYLDIDAVEGLQLMNDPTLGPVIRNLMAQFAGGAQGLLQGNNGGGRPPGQGQFKGYGREE